jgi:DNA-binding Lrp family transcriptional regulator
MTTTKAEKRKYRGIEDLYEAEDNLRAAESRESRLSVVPSTDAPVVTLRQKTEVRDTVSEPKDAELNEVNNEVFSLPDSNRLLESDSSAYQNNRLLNSNSLPDSNSLATYNTQSDEILSLMASLPEAGGFMKFWHQLTDHLYRQLTPAEQVVHLQLYRLSWGHGNSNCQIGLPKLAERAGISRSTAQQAVNGLVKKGLIKKVRIIIGSDKPQGVEYAITPPPSMVKSTSLPESNRLLDSGRLVKSTLIKETHIKETHTNTDALADAREKDGVGVRVASRFTLQECRRYAENLRADGITNPGGYATKIHRSGEADDLIAKFLNPPEATLTIDARACPDCNGTGWRESNNPEQKGVVRCKHEKLSSG